MPKITTRELAEKLNLEVVSGEKGLDRIITTDEKRLSNFRRMHGGAIGGINQWSEKLSENEFRKIEKNKYFK